MSSEESTDLLTTDCDLERRVRIFLGERHLPVLRRLEISVHNGTVVLSGRVRTFYERQVAVHSCRRVAGVREVVDRLRVVDAMPAAASAAG
jgi:osmotically-inducible protein OsmY